MTEEQAPPQQPEIDPIVNFLSRVEITDDFIREIQDSGKSFETYKKYYKASDIFIILNMLHQVDMWEPDPENPNYKAFRTLMKWFIYLMGTNPWWHRKLAYYNRMMGTCMSQTSYWKLTYHPGYIPGAHLKSDYLNKHPEEFNAELMNNQEIYQWVDKNVTDACDDGLDFNDDDLLNDDSTKKVNPIKPKKKRRNHT